MSEVTRDQWMSRASLWMPVDMLCTTLALVPKRREVKRLSSSLEEKA